MVSIMSLSDFVLIVTLVIF